MLKAGFAVEDEGVEGGGGHLGTPESRAQGILRVVLASHVDSQDPCARDIVSAYRYASDAPFSKGEAGRGAAIVGATAVSQLDDELLDQLLEAVSATGLVYGVDPSRVLYVFDQLLQLGRRIPGQTSKRSGLPESSQEICFDIVVDMMGWGPSIKRPSCVSRHDIRDGEQSLEGGRSGSVRLTDRDRSGDDTESSDLLMVESRGGV